MLQTYQLWKALVPIPYDYFRRLGSFETGKSVIDSSLFMMHDPESYSFFAKLTWLIEERNR